MKECSLDMILHVEENTTRKRSKKMSKSSNIMEILPHEILVHIVSKLPASVILNCCNPLPKLSYNNTMFNNIISDSLFPSLFKSNNNNNKSSSYTSFLAYDHFHTHTLLIDYNQEDDHLSEFRINMELILGSHTFIVLASCNGWLLVCLMIRPCSPDLLVASLRLVNPITRHCIDLPDVPYSRYPSSTHVNYGLGYSSKTGQLKVVTLFNHVHNPEFTAKVFTVGGESGWEIIDAENRGPNLTAYLQSFGEHMILTGATALNGALHWLVAWRDDNEIKVDRYNILVYDIDEKEFEYFPTPLTLDMTDGQMGVLEGMLCCAGAYASTNSITGVEIWVMKEYGVAKSWTCFTIIDYIDIREPFSLIPWLKNGKLIVLSHVAYDRKFYVDVYDVKERKRDQWVSLLEGLDENLRNRMIIEPFVPSLL